MEYLYIVKKIVDIIILIQVLFYAFRYSMNKDIHDALKAILLLGVVNL